MRRALQLALHAVEEMKSAPLSPSGHASLPRLCLPPRGCLACACMPTTDTGFSVIVPRMPMPRGSLTCSEAESHPEGELCQPSSEQHHIGGLMTSNHVKHSVTPTGTKSPPLTRSPARLSLTRTLHTTMKPQVGTLPLSRTNVSVSELPSWYASTPDSRRWRRLRRATLSRPTWAQQHRVPQHSVTSASASTCSVHHAEAQGSRRALCKAQTHAPTDRREASWPDTAEYGCFQF